jgi:Plavaka transposase
LKIGDWYWNGTTQKSQEGFKKLINIIGDESFRPSDVRHTKWDQINKELARDSEQASSDEWLDEDAGWTRTPITINVPFDRNMSDCGTKEYTAVDFYHRSLVEVIREKLSDKTDDTHFHYEPYELHWQPRDESDPLRVYGELYTAPAFLEAHHELQTSAGEPGCNLPRVVVGLMFGSDSTHLTSFGDAKLWPLYLYFGNDSKYRRCKPSNHLGCHVAYFNGVCYPQFSFF